MDEIAQEGGHLSTSREWGRPPRRVSKLRFASGPTNLFGLPTVGYSRVPWRSGAEGLVIVCSRKSVYLEVGSCCGGQRLLGAAVILL